eukprot:XP_022280022.1 reticulon-4-like [Canis lupus familiaris]
MEDMDQSPLVSSSSDSPPRPQPPFKYQFVRDPEDEEEDEEEEDEEDEDEDLEELEVLERKPAAGLSAAPVPPAAAAVPGAPLLDFGSDFVPPAPRGPLPTAPPAAPERPPSWDPSPTSPAGPAPSLPSAAAASPSKFPRTMTLRPGLPFVYRPVGIPVVRTFGSSRTFRRDGRAPPVVWRVRIWEGESSGKVLPPPSLLRL